MIKPVLRKIKRLANKIFGTKVDELYWEFRHIFDKKWAESYISKQSIEHPHRRILADTISKYFPFESVLEIGCGSGPNLYLLAKKFPKAKFYGIDISKKAIKTGNDFFEKENIKNVFLNSAKAEDLKKFKDKSIDLVFTDAVLLYIGPEKINLIIKEILRVTKKAIIFSEMHHDLSDYIYKDNWIYNYRLLFKKFISEEKIKINKLPRDNWSGSWRDYGYIIEIRL